MHLPRQSLPRIIFALFTAVLVAGCSGSGSGVTVESVTSTVPTIESSSVSESSQALSSSTSSPSTLSAAGAPTSDVDAAEAADRSAAEAQWIKSWDVYLEMARTPAAERDALASTVTTGSAKSNMLTDAQQFDQQGLETYGQIGHRISWPQPIDGADTAVIDDCQDRSNTGSLETATGNKVTVGVAGRHYQGQLSRGNDGVWRVAQSYYLKDEPC